MSRSPVPVTPEVLCWARTSMNMPLEEVARRMRKQPSDIEAWEKGERAPTYIQLETLAYKIYKRPIALFFFPNIPDEEDIKSSFRSLPESAIQNMPPRVHYLLRKARAYQLSLAELYDGINPSDRSIVQDFSLTTSTELSEITDKIRSYLGVRLEEQYEWESIEIAFKNWREQLENTGVFIFKDSFRSRAKGNVPSPLSSFCLQDEVYPIIYINNNNSISRQIFSLFHELAHLLMNTSGIEYREDATRDITKESLKVEYLCNQFAASILVPISNFQKLTSGITINDNSVSDWAKKYKVSREVILRRLLDQGRISKEYYRTEKHDWSEDTKRQGSGGDYYLTKVAYLDGRYMEEVFRQYYQSKISLGQAADYLDIKAKNLPNLEDYYLKFGIKD